MNIANMPLQVVRGLRERGHQAEQVHYHNGQGHAFGFDLDIAPNLKELGGRISGHAEILRCYLERDFEIFHFWNKSMFFDLKYQELTGFDIPLLKTRGKRVAYRFTGFDLRLPSWDREINRFSPHNLGFEHQYDEDLQKKYIDFLKEHVDAFVVQDPEMAQFAPPGTVIIPRALDLTQWHPVGLPNKTERPLIVHAPSSQNVKGSKFVLKALDELQEEGCKFDFKLIDRLSHEEARSWYKKADIIVDQLLIGATGVLTLEAWALGKPCVVNLRRDLFDQFYNTSDLPVGNANPETIKSVLKELIKDEDRRKDLSQRGRQLVEDFHSLDKVIPQYEAFYLRLMEREPTQPTGVGDVVYLAEQAKLSEAARFSKARALKKLARAEKKVVALNEKIIALERNAPFRQRMKRLKKRVKRVKCILRIGQV